VNRPLTDKELERVRVSLERGRPFGDEQWVARTVRRLHLEHTVRREGRPSKRGAAGGAGDAPAGQR
jgi:putative transposase